MKSLELLKIIDFLQNNITGSKFSKFSSVHFFYSESCSINIWLLVLEFFYKSKILNLEHVYLNNKNTSKPTVDKIINDAVFNKFLEKEVNLLDKRKVNLLPSQQTILEFELLIKEFNNIE